MEIEHRPRLLRRARLLESIAEFRTAFAKLLLQPGDDARVHLTDAALREAEPPAAPTQLDPAARNNIARRIALRPAGKRFGPDVSLAWVMGFLALGACIVPWPRHGWLWFELIVTIVALLVCYDAIALWLTEDAAAPVLLPSEKGLRGREGQTIQIPLALTGSGRNRRWRDVRVGIMPATQESEAAIRVKKEPQRLKLEQSNSSEDWSTQGNTAQLLLWPWT